MNRYEYIYQISNFSAICQIFMLYGNCFSVDMHHWHPSRVRIWESIRFVTQSIRSVLQFVQSYMKSFISSSKLLHETAVAFFQFIGRRRRWSQHLNVYACINISMYVCMETDFNLNRLHASDIQCMRAAVS